MDNDKEYRNNCKKEKYDMKKDASMYKKLLMFVISAFVFCAAPVLAKNAQSLEKPTGHLPRVLYQKAGKSNAADYDKAVVLVLDCSGSMYGTPIKNMKASAKGFCEKVLGSDVNVGIGIVRFANSNEADTTKVCGITSELDKLQTAIDTQIQATGMTDIYDGSNIAFEMLQTCNAKQKYIILMTDGYPCIDLPIRNGRQYLLKEDGPYNELDVDRTTKRLMNAVFELYGKIKSTGKFTVYTVGISPDESMIQFLQNLASENGGYYTAETADDIADIFDALVPLIAPSATLSSEKLESEGDIAKFKIKVKVTNTNLYKTLENVTATLKLDEAAVITIGEETQTKAKLAPSKDAAFTWEIEVDKAKYKDSIDYSYSVEIGADNINASTLSGTVRIGKKPNEITYDKIAVTWDGKKKSFSLNARALGGNLTYESSNASVIKVDKKGQVTISKGFLGEATITIRATGSDEYEDATKVINLKVVPKQTYVKTFRRSGNSLIVEWEKFTNLDGYQIQVGLDKKFEDANNIIFKKTIKSGKTNSVSFKPKTITDGYYVRLRTYKSYQGKKYYSDWRVDPVGSFVTKKKN